MIIYFENFKFYKEGVPITYSGVILDNKSKNKLLEFFIYSSPYFENWMRTADHMTICMGSLPKHTRENYLDEEVILTVTHFGYNEKVAAVKVDGLFTINKSKADKDEGPSFQHITLAYNPNIGKPQMSNSIENWIAVDNFNITGTIKEVKL